MQETPSQLRISGYVMNFPFTLDTKEPNNIWMKELDEQGLKINRNKAYMQFLDLYNFIAGDAVVYLIPSKGNYQDQVYTANVGSFLPHIKEVDNIILSNFTSPPRKGEEFVAKEFFDMMGYKNTLCPHKWEGEADLKYLRDNIDNLAKQFYNESMNEA